MISSGDILGSVLYVWGVSGFEMSFCFWVVCVVDVVFVVGVGFVGFVDTFCIAN